MVSTIFSVENDLLIKINEDETISEILVESIHTDILDESDDVYNFSCEPYDWYFAGNILVHNK